MVDIICPPPVWILSSPCWPGRPLSSSSDHWNSSTPPCSAPRWSTATYSFKINDWTIFQPTYSDSTPVLTCQAPPPPDPPPGEGLPLGLPPPPACIGPAPSPSPRPCTNSLTLLDALCVYQGFKKADWGMLQGQTNPKSANKMSKFNQKFNPPPFLFFKEIFVFVKSLHSTLFQNPGEGLLSMTEQQQEQNQE